jgi:hypothetical protein
MHVIGHNNEAMVLALAFVLPLINFGDDRRRRLFVSKNPITTFADSCNEVDSSGFRVSSSTEI